MRAGAGERTRLMKSCAVYLKYDVATNPRARYCLPGVKNARAAASSRKPVPAPIQAASQCVLRRRRLEARAGAEGCKYESDGFSSEDNVRFGRLVSRPAFWPVRPRLPAAGEVARDDVAVDRVRKHRDLRGTRTEAIEYPRLSV